VYGGGGPQVFMAAAGVPGAKAKPTFGGGGHFGLELFFAPHASLFVEIGGTSGAQAGLGAGGTAMAGVQWYP